MAKAVKVTYTDLKPPILTIQDAIAAQSFFPSNDQEVIKGDAEGAIAAAPHIVTGEVSCDTQYHFHMETQVCKCTPLEDGMEVQASTQALDSVQTAVSQATGLAAHSVYVSVKRVGGGFGGKLSRSCVAASACAVAAQVLNRPVCLSMSLKTNMETIGKRAPYLGKYKVGCDADGRLLGIDYQLYENQGCSSTDSCLDYAVFFADSAYFCPNWRYVGTACQTNIASTTMTRAPGCISAHFFMEHIMDHVAATLGKDPGELRRLNMFQADLFKSAEVKRRKEEIEDFNKTNRWKKRGLSMVPIRYPIHWAGIRFTVFVAIYHTDGSVVITHGGIEMGQGINTKVMQVAAAKLGVPMEIVHVMATNSLSGVNSSASGGSVSSELNCKGVLECCRRLNERMDPIRQEMGGAPKWAELINMCHKKGLDLSEKYMEYPPPTAEGTQYTTWGATCTEVELDVLTGERQITRTDIVHDSGESLNPDVDVGQVEGGFVFGLGYWLTEQCRYDTKTGQLLTNGTWEYKPPTTKDIPIDLRVTLLPNAPNPHGVLRSKACGEPPLLMSCSALLALRQAVRSARAEVGHDDFFPLACM
uniref:Uncharacterized protein n=1 Tax=Branchiostoma floridae TaxID=7739 RepID=C4A0Z8_BRAFL|eukprot:XP_002585528.1 hypothetical protein BRAFLDRAFT_89258 [Branchiostoma floridae]